MDVTDMQLSFQALLEQSPDAAFSEWLRMRAEHHWTEMVNHRFTRDLGADRLPEAAFARYLRNEHDFVHTAVAVFARALVSAPTADDRRHVAEILHALTHEQEDYFREARSAPGADAAPEDEVPSGTALGLSEGVLAITADATYEEILSAMLAAEWMYLEWCGREHLRGPTKPAPARWIAMHAGGEFAAGVGWTRRRVDSLCPALDPRRQERCARNFRRMLQLEISFHDAAYGDA